jgi:hypothetical protein
VYEKEWDACQRLLHGRVTMQKSDAPLTSKALKSKQMTLWPNINNWSVAPLGKGCFEFQFHSIEEMRKILSQGVVYLKPGIFRLFCWSKDFNPFHQVQTHAQVWVRLMHLPWEYWQYQTLFEIASGLGTPLVIDDATQARLFGLYARVLVDVDLFSKLFDIVIVEREGYPFSVEVQYERQPAYCSHCKLLEHTIQ